IYLITSVEKPRKNIQGEIEMNRFVGVGRLTKDVSLNYTQNGKAVANYTVAINRPFKNQQGENEADFINGVVWGKGAENLANYMKKGSQIGIDGRLQTRTYENNNGQTVFVTEVVADSVQFLESRGSNQQQSQPKQQPQQTQQQHQTFGQAGENLEISDQDLPF